MQKLESPVSILPRFARKSDENEDITLDLKQKWVIHNCSHANNDSAHYRVTEEQIFVAIFAYIEHLFSKIKPKQVFFMAIDGVAPRAKMNQQRSRRFRTAKEAKDLRDKAVAKGETLPDEPPFDSNCITPGTPFMARLQQQLKYFIVKKVNEDAHWRECQVILSGHDVPGEGEHKIMEYIRLAKAQPNYNPNLRHCLYGLDADLIMLGLLSHDPHFCLLREEVVFGPQRKKAKTLETQNFYLMHLSLFREYLDLEFSSLATDPELGFQYDLERIIDDWILLVIFVGNDFLPHLPGIHIHDGALNLLYQIYKRVLPKAGGYLNEHGTLNVKRLQLVLNELATFEQEIFEQEFADSNWFRGKQQTHIEAMEKARARSRLTLTVEQRHLFEQIKTFALSIADTKNVDSELQFPAKYPARDRRFLSDLADELRLSISFDEHDEQEEPVIALRLDAETADMLHEEMESASNPTNGDHDDSGEWRQAIERVLNKYEKATTLQDQSESDFEDEYTLKLRQKMDVWKREYYKEKMSIDYNTPDQMHSLVYRYVEGLQWVLHYYYDGVAAWGWFYDYHYSPKISDLKGVDKFEFNFDLGAPFKPFEQLMGVLPDLSKQFIPAAFRDLMTDPASPIIDFYPRNFESDLNGKKQEWEAVVKIPFIDEKRLLSTMQTREAKLTPEERRRNNWGPSWHCRYSSSHDETYPSSLPGFFPDLTHVHSVLEEYPLPTLDGLRLVKGLCEGVLLGKDAVAGFPSLQTLAFAANLGYQSVNVFQSDSRNESMVITVDSAYDGLKVEELAQSLVGKRIYANWPYLKESMVVAISDDLFRYELDQVGHRTDVTKVPHRPDEMMSRRRTVERLEHVYAKRFAVVIGTVDVLLHVKPIKGLKLMEDGALIKDFDDRETEQPLQTTVESVASLDHRYEEHSARPVEEDYPQGTRVFFLGSKPSYGCAAQVMGHRGGNLQIVTAFFPSEASEFLQYRNLIRAHSTTRYHPSFQVTRRIKMSALTLSKITSSLMLYGPDDTKVNAGLNLKFEAKSLKVLGYTRKTDAGWEYSDKAIELIEEYKVAFPEICFMLDQQRSNDIKDIERIYPGVNISQKMKQIKDWTKEHKIEELEKVPLDSEQLETETVQALERLADELSSQKQPDLLKKAVVNAVPRRALLKPEQAKAKLQHQIFQPGDRVTMIEEAGNVPLSAKGTVIGIQPGFLDTLWDVPFIGGTNLSNRCSLYRGMAVTPDSILNLSSPQLVAMIPNAGAQSFEPAAQGRGTGRGRGRGFWTAAPNRGSQPTRILSNGSNGRASAHNYKAATQNAPGAYVSRPDSTQQSRLQDALQPDGPRPYSSRQDYRSVPPPASLSQPRPSRGRGTFTRGSPAARILQTAQPASQSIPTGPARTQNNSSRGSPSQRVNGYRGRGQSDRARPTVASS